MKRTPHRHEYSSRQKGRTTNFTQRPIVPVPAKEGKASAATKCCTVAPSGGGGGGGGGVPTTRQIATVNGLQGGGDLSVNRTLSPVYGNTAGTVCQGNDPRLIAVVPPFALGTFLDNYFVEDSIDPQLRYQLNHFPPLNAGNVGGHLRLGQNQVDGDPLFREHDGMTVWGPAPGAAGGSMTSVLWSMARVKSTRYGLQVSNPAGQFYWFRVDGDRLIFRKLTDQSILFNVEQATDLIQLGWNNIEIGNNLAGDKYIKMKNGAATPPAVRWNEGGQRWEFSTDGVTYPFMVNGLDAFGRHQVLFVPPPNGAFPPQGGVIKCGMNQVDGDPGFNVGGGFTTWALNPANDPYDANNWAMARMDAADGFWLWMSKTPGVGQISWFEANAIDLAYRQLSDARDLFYVDQATDLIKLGRNVIEIGDGANLVDKEIVAKNGTLTPPKIRFNHTSNIWEYSNDGLTWAPLGGGAGNDVTVSVPVGAAPGNFDSTAVIPVGALIKSVVAVVDVLYGGGNTLDIYVQGATPLLIEANTDINLAVVDKFPVEPLAVVGALNTGVVRGVLGGAPSPGSSARIIVTYTVPLA